MRRKSERNKRNSQQIKLAGEKPFVNLSMAKIKIVLVKLSVVLLSNTAQTFIPVLLIYFEVKFSYHRKLTVGSWLSCIRRVTGARGRC